jgi:hypothetical protein
VPGSRTCGRGLAYGGGCFGESEATACGYEGVNQGSAPSLEVAVSALSSARAVFEQTRLWQPDMYEHYQLGNGEPARATL